MVIAIACLLVALLLGLFIFRSRGDSGQATLSRRSRGRQSADASKESALEPRLSEFPELDDAETDEVLGLRTSLHEGVVLNEGKSQPEANPESSRQPEIIALNVMAPTDYPYQGYELLQALLANGLRYGEMQIFHRHETKTGRGKVLFSLASASKPGTFELPKMGSFSSPGLSLFVVLKRNIDCMLAFDTMLETAKQLADDLGGEVWDGAHRSLNMDTVAKLRSQIKRFEESQRAPDLFADAVDER